MLGIREEGEERPSSKCFFTCGTLQSYINGEQPPTKKQPYSTIRSNRFNHTAELILPEETYQEIGQTLLDKLTKVKYCTVILPLAALLEKDFFISYIKNGNIIMISEGRKGIDNTFSICDGLLRLSLDRETYERAGIVGKPDGPTKTKRGKSRWVVDINLRLPSMMHGKKGFERIVKAFKNVLNHSVSWLFCDLDPKEISLDPITRHHPTYKVSEPETFRTPSIKVPPFSLSRFFPPTEKVEPGTRESLEDGAIELYEWLSLVRLESPRIHSDDSIDPFLSRYNVPNGPDSNKTVLHASMVRLRWRGLLPANWITELWIKTLSLLSSGWFALAVQTFEQNEFVVLRQPPPQSTSQRETGDDWYVLWDIEGPVRL